MTATPFDPLQTTHDLEAAGFERRQAEAIARTIDPGEPVVGVTPPPAESRGAPMADGTIDEVLQKVGTLLARSG